MREGLGMDKIMRFYISPDLIFSITVVSVKHFHNHLCIFISPKVLKEIFAKLAYTLSRTPHPHPPYPLFVDEKNIFFINPSLTFNSECHKRQQQF